MAEKFKAGTCTGENHFYPGSELPCACGQFSGWREQLDETAADTVQTVTVPVAKYTVDRAAYDAHKAMCDGFVRAPLSPQPSRFLYLPPKQGMSISESSALYCNEMRRVPVVDDPTNAVSLGDIGQTIDWYTRRIAASTTGLPYEVFYPAAAPYLKTMRDSAASDRDRLAAISWLRLNGHDHNGGGISHEMDMVMDDIAMLRLAAAGALPDGGPTKAECMDKFKSVEHLMGNSPPATKPTPLPLDSVSTAWAATWACPECDARVSFDHQAKTWRCPGCSIRSILCLTPPKPQFYSGMRLVADEPMPGDYVRWDHREYRNWAEGELVELTRPRKDLVARIKVDRSNFLAVGTVQGVGIEHGARFCQAKRPPSDDKGSISAGDAALVAAGYVSLAEVAPRRPDGFDQRQVDAAKAVLLASVPKKAKP